MQANSTRDIVPGFSTGLKAARKQKDWTLRQLAEVSGVHEMTIVKLEGGQRMPSLRVALALARALGLPVEGLIAQPAAEPKMTGKKSGKK